MSLPIDHGADERERATNPLNRYRKSVTRSVAHESEDERIRHVLRGMDAVTYCEVHNLNGADLAVRFWTATARYQVVMSIDDLACTTTRQLTAFFVDALSEERS